MYDGQRVRVRIEVEVEVEVEVEMKREEVSRGTSRASAASKERTRRGFYEIEKGRCSAQGKHSTFLAVSRNSPLLQQHRLTRRHRTRANTLSAPDVSTDPWQASFSELLMSIPAYCGSNETRSSS